jgi:hypothetical protein
MAYRPRRTRKPCRRSKDGHHASRKPIGIPTASALVSTTYHADNEFARRRGPNPDRRRALELLSGCGAESCGDP